MIGYLQIEPYEPSMPVCSCEVAASHTQGLKELALSVGIRILAVAAADQVSLQSRRVWL